MIALGTLTLIILITLINSRTAIIKALFPESPPPETVAFATLRPIDLSEGIKPEEGISYQLKTVTGNLPEFPKKAKVFAVGEKSPSFGIEQILKGRAGSLGLNQKPASISRSVYKFTSEGTQASYDRPRTLTYDTLTGTYSLTSTMDPGIIVRKLANIESQSEAARSFFSVMGLDQKSFPKTKQVVKKLRFDNGKLVETDSLSTTELVEVDFYYEDFDALPVTYIKKGGSPIFAIVANDRVIYAKKDIRDIELFKFATYPLKPVAQAWEELKQGRATFNSTPDSKSIDIKEVNLGYVITTNTNGDVQPVYLFKGPEDFIAFVPAVSDKWIAKN